MRSTAPPLARKYLPRDLDEGVGYRIPHRGEGALDDLVFDVHVAPLRGEVRFKVASGGHSTRPVASAISTRP